MPTLVDTSVWIDHFRVDSPSLRRLLDDDQVVCHPLVIGELACGNLRQRSQVLGALAMLPAAPTIDHEELLTFIEAHKLYGQGLGWIDVHLLASAVLERVSLWTFDQSLRTAARKLHCEY
ncbi:type II toxin-antitoxin system VapC family toxin [Nitrospira moscoviensis]|jgi:predicted nucleic acid-binding protein|uniref:Ribonuclease VapC n=1 Tax=Nitrospira moscoviensis TaxID=42253 RepID=A0A0K2GFB8_NITMO|nr:PIN domain-containing protein [Nitrospira moscoviensis]ALA59653.1 putative ribonuclease VapC32 [Nitrospira moscoviensis]